ncbi:hypothetical protein ZIOFF_060768 [Zingiber officinale]|uniref:EF-hand domain-containing protein n=1 Tax=Zingiber officinale TaxID=94328 RepID=A0A8J5KCA1_ZINOF|nr:hypothetical protein ZIOFF_060768 [Zingiber officinale]
MQLSLFAEAFNEMLQFEMGCRLLSFLEKLNKKYTLKRNSRKRQRDEKPEKVSDKEKSPIKRTKSNDSPVAKEDTCNKDKGEAANIVSESVKSGKEDVSDKTVTENKDADGSSVRKLIAYFDLDDKVNVKVEQAESEVDVKMDVDSVVMNESNTDKIGNDNKAANANEAADKNTKPANANEAVAEDNKQNADQTDTVKDKDCVKTVKEASTGDGVVDKELLEAFRYFDKNRTGYIKVHSSQLRQIHVKQTCQAIGCNLSCISTNLPSLYQELAQSALLESNSARDDRVFYKKLVKMAIGDI